MADTKAGREAQAREAQRRQQERDVTEALERADETEPPLGESEEDANREERRRVCHRRGCTEPAAFLVLERYLEETGHGPVEAKALLCRGHTREETPTNLDGVYDDYVFIVEPLPETGASND